MEWGVSGGVGEMMLHCSIKIREGLREQTGDCNVSPLLTRAQQMAHTCRGEATGPSLEGSDRETPRRQLSSRFLAGMDHSQGRGMGVQQGADQGWSLWGNDPMQTGTPHATSGGRRLYTQDSFKEDGGTASPEDTSGLHQEQTLRRWGWLWSCFANRRHFCG